MTNIIKIVRKNNTVNVTKKQSIVTFHGKGARGISGFSFLSGNGIPSNLLGINGDTYLDVQSGYLYNKVDGVWIQGTKIVPVSEFSFTYEQQSPSNIWNITHNLEFRPAVSVMDYGQNNIECDIEHVDENSLILTFSDPISGHAYLS